MPSFADLTTQVSLVVFAQALALMVSAPSFSEAEKKPALVAVEISSATSSGGHFQIMAPPIEISGPIVAGKFTDRLVPADTIFMAQSNDPSRGNGSAQGRPAGPPREAIVACGTKSQGAACTFKGQNGEAFGGLCRPGPRGEAAACVSSVQPPFQRGVDLRVPDDLTVIDGRLL